MMDLSQTLETEFIEKKKLCSPSIILSVEMLKIPWAALILTETKVVIKLFKKLSLSICTNLLKYYGAHIIESQVAS